ncbi:MAG: protein translocase subunit SecF, partial [Bacteroidota bacterium]|nr:protein translocase subunit SecF [Bacteroidota bacterium]
GPTISDDIKKDAAISIFFALVIIFLYILIRFRNWQYGLGGLVSLTHDTIITLGVFSLFAGVLPFSLEIDQAFIAAILTVIGYSINDTVIVYDRVREYLHLYPKRKLDDNMNHAMNSTLRRTFSTSLSTLVVLIAIFMFGGTSIQGFTFALLVGIGVGTYSSIFVATPIVYDALSKIKKADRA